MKKCIGLIFTIGIASSVWFWTPSDAGACSCQAFEPESEQVTLVRIRVPGDDAERLEREQERWAVVSQVDANLYSGIQLRGWKDLAWGTRYTTIDFAPSSGEDTGLDTGNEGGKK